MVIKMMNFHLIRDVSIEFDEKVESFLINKLDGFYVILSEDTREVDIFFQKAENSNHKDVWFYSEYQSRCFVCDWFNATTTISDVIKKLTDEYDFSENCKIWFRPFSSEVGNADIFVCNDIDFAKSKELFNFASNELNILMDKIIKENANSEEEANEIKTNYIKANTSILELMHIIISQNMNSEVLNYVMPLLNRLLKKLPLSELTEGDKWNPTEIEDDDGNVIHENEDEIFVNSRMENVIKRVKSTGETTYEKLDSVLFKNEEGDILFDKEKSSKEIEMPYVPSDPEIELISKEDEEERKDFLIKL